MKRKNLLLIAFILVSTLFVSCDSLNAIKQDTPTNTGVLLDTTIKTKDYERFNDLFTEERKNTVSKEKLNEFNSLSTAGTGYQLYEVMTYTNGEMLLVTLTPGEADGKYKIQDVVKIPEEMKKLFQN